MNESINGITVSGEGTVAAPPDVAKISIGVSALRGSAGEAREAAAASLQRTIDALKSSGVADRDVQTQRMTISPEYDDDKGKQRQRGVRATNVVGVTLRDLDAAGATLDAAMAAGGDDAVLHGIEFTVENPEALEDEARRAAVADARRKAEALASAAAVSLGSALRVVELSGERPMPRPMMAAMRAEAMPEPTPVVPGEIEVRVGVEVTWAIG